MKDGRHQWVSFYPTLRVAARLFVLQLIVSVAAATAAVSGAADNDAPWAAETIPAVNQPSNPPKTSEKPDEPAAPPAGMPAARATAVEISGDGSSTSIALDLTEGVTAEIFTLADPYRVVIDLPDLGFDLDAAAANRATGLVSAFRFGLFAEGKARIVIETTGPVQIGSAAMASTGKGPAQRLTIALMPMQAAAFGAGTGASRPPEAVPAPVAMTGAKKPKGKARPVVVIDAGHGGIDPGAVGADAIAEKTIVLDVARQLKMALSPACKCDVRMTRSSDVFVSLDRRLALSEEYGADLFISLHADSIAEQAIAHNIRGATVYTLSARASDAEARRRAEQENASDLVAGLQNTDAPGADQVKSILMDLIKRETSNFSADFSNVVTAKLGKSIALSRDPQRSAAFKVLKQAHAPSVLIELGYMSNVADQQQMMTLEWQQKVAKAIATAVQTYFAKRTRE